ncbi:MAG: (2Fe-2S) ferredoxin domain-containing protein [Cyanobacteria bacterium J06638_20]
MAKENLFLCMGSACHQLGVYDVLPQLQALIKKYGLEDDIELKGSFCLETCSQGIVMKFHGVCFTNISPQDVEAKFEANILPAIQASLSAAQPLT